MKILIIINTSKYPEHRNVGDIFKKAFEVKGYEVKQIDLGPIQKEYVKSGMIENEKPQLLVTFDMAGFEMRTLLEKATYNTMPYRMAHFLLKDYEAYKKEWLEDDMNFSMFFYASEQTGQAIKERHPDIEHVTVLETCSVEQWGKKPFLVECQVNTVIGDTEIENDY